MSDDLSRQLIRREAGEAPGRRELAARGSNSLISESLELQGHPGVDDDRINLREYWHVLLKRKWTVLLFLAVVLAAAVFTTLLMTPLYQAKTTLQIDLDTLKVTQFQSVTPTETGWDNTKFYRTQYELLKSRSLAERVVQELDLVNSPLVNPPKEKQRVDDGWLQLLFGGEAEKAQEFSAQQSEESILAQGLLASLTVAPVKDSRLVELRFVSTDAGLSATILNAWADAFIALNIERRFDATAYARKFLQERLQDLKTKLEYSEEELAKFSRSRGIINLGEQLI